MLLVDDAGVLASWLQKYVVSTRTWKQSWNGARRRPNLTKQLGCLERKLSAALQRENDLRQRVEAAGGQPKAMQPEEQVVQELEMAKRDAHIARSRAAESEDQEKKLAELLAQETARIRELESELDHQREISIRLEQDAEFSVLWYAGS